MALYTSTAVDGPTGINSLTQDPPKPTEAGVESLINGSNPDITVTTDAVLRVIARGSGYSDATGLATTTTTAALNDWSGQSVHNPALTTITVDITTVNGEIVSAVVDTGAASSVGYKTGDWISVTQSGGSGGVLELSSTAT